MHTRIFSKIFAGTIHELPSTTTGRYIHPVSRISSMDYPPGTWRHILRLLLFFYEYCLLSYCELWRLLPFPPPPRFSLHITTTQPQPRDQVITALQLVHYLQQEDKNHEYALRGPVSSVRQSALYASYVYSYVSDIEGWRSFRRTEAPDFHTRFSRGRSRMELRPVKTCCKSTAAYCTYS